MILLSAYHVAACWVNNCGQRKILEQQEPRQVLLLGGVKLWLGLGYCPSSTLEELAELFAVTISSLPCVYITNRK